MSIDINKIKVGDSVQIANGDWYEVKATNTCNSFVIYVPASGGRTGSAIPKALLTDHRPAQPEPEEWVTEEELRNDAVFPVVGAGTAQARRINALLTRKYGQPPAPKDRKIGGFHLEDGKVVPNSPAPEDTRNE
jgi:hypothetical protein